MTSPPRAILSPNGVAERISQALAAIRSAAPRDEVEQVDTIRSWNETATCSNRIGLNGGSAAAAPPIDAVGSVVEVRSSLHAWQGFR